jgi:hypothetical protein
VRSASEPFDRHWGRLQVVVEKGRNLSPELQGMQLACTVQVGDAREVTGLREADGSEQQQLKWHETFAFTVAAPQEALATAVLFAQAGGDEAAPKEPVVVGHIAVPIARVQASGKEEGWYEVRTSEGEVAPAPPLFPVVGGHFCGGGTRWLEVGRRGLSGALRAQVVLGPKGKTSVLIRFCFDAEARRVTTLQ